MTDINRRSLLQLGGTTFIAGFAGCGALAESSSATYPLVLRNETAETQSVFVQTTGIKDRFEESVQIEATETLLLQEFSLENTNQILISADVQQMENGWFQQKFDKDEWQNAAGIIIVISPELIDISHVDINAIKRSDSKTQTET